MKNIMIQGLLHDHKHKKGSTMQEINDRMELLALYETTDEEAARTCINRIIDLAEHSEKFGDTFTEINVSDLDMSSFRGSWFGKGPKIGCTFIVLVTSRDDLLS